MALKNGRSSVAAQSILVGSVIPAGTIAPFGGGTVPTGWLLCDGSAVSRTTYAGLFAVLSTSNGSGDGSTTFNLPDLQGKFLRGRVQISTASGSGSAASNNATFAAHGIKRTGFKVRLTSGTLTGLATATDYYVIVVDANTLAFATSLANALAGTKIAISGANSAVISQWEDPDSGSRLSATVGGSSGNSIGASQESDNRSHLHFTVASQGQINNTAINTSFAIANNGLQGGGNYAYQLGSGTTAADVSPSSSSGGNETRPSNTLINYIIKA
jgi:microcystin-dependent protein